MADKRKEIEMNIAICKDASKIWYGRLGDESWDQTDVLEQLHNADHKLVELEEQLRVFDIEHDKDQKPKTGRAWYKCRMCGKIYLDGLEGSATIMERALTDVALLGKDMNNRGHSLRPMTVHHCDDYNKNPGDRIGIADLIGIDIIE